MSQKRSGSLDKDWIEIVEEWDLDINPDTLRRAAIGVELALDAGLMDDSGNGYIERQQLRDLTAQVNKQYRTEARSALLREAIIDAASRLRPFSPTGSYRRTESDDYAYASKAMVLAIGDIHYGADIRVEGLNDEPLNVYNSHVFEERMAELYDETLRLIETHDIGEVHVFLVGDLLDGMLRQSQLMKLEYGMVDSTMQVAEYLAGWIAHLSEHVRVNVCGVTGNHSEIRPLKSRNREFEDENLERIVMWYIAERLRLCKNVTVSALCKRMQKVTVKGYKFLLLHGDGEQSIENIARDSVNLYGEPIDFFICGHLHRNEGRFCGVSNSGNSMVIRVPSICGMDKYAQSKGYGGRPGAVAMVVSDNTNDNCIYNLKLK